MNSPAAAPLPAGLYAPALASEKSAPGERGRIAFIDGLRGIAALLILQAHWIGIGVPAEYGTPLHWFKRAFVLSGSGVDLFFVLSGFLISGILIDHRTSPNLLRVFWIRRSLRILPLFAVFLAVFLLLSRGPDPLLAANSHPFWAHALFLSNIWMAITNAWDASFLSMSWSLAIEEQFYLVLPFVVLGTPPRYLRGVAIATIVGTPFLRLAVWACSPASFSMAAHALMPCRADAFAVGLLIACEMRREKPFWSSLPLSRLWLAGAGLALVLAWLTVRNEWSGSLIYCLVGYTALACFYGWCIVLSLRVAGAAKVFAWPPLRWVGRHSYFIYLFHGCVAIVTHHIAARWLDVQDWSAGMQLLAATLLLVTLSAASMRWFEGPLLKHGRLFPYADAPVPASS